MVVLSATSCLGFINNRTGCLIIAFVETCWILANFVFSILALHKACGDWIMRMDYFREEPPDLREW